jgi:tetratricopeptide (TPR) repeat protein
MIYFLVLALIAAVFSVDPSLYMPYTAPKALLLAILPPIVLLAKLLFDFIKSRGSVLSLSLIECLIACRIVWEIFSNVDILIHPASGELFYLVSLLIVSFVARQMAMSPAALGPLHPGIVSSVKEPDSLRIFLRAIWIIGVCQAIIGLAQYSLLFDFLPIGTKKTPMIGTIGTANGFGSFIAISLVALVADSQKIQTIESKLSRLVAGAFLIASLILNGSRGAILSVVCSLCVLGLIYLRSKVRVSKRDPIDMDNPGAGGSLRKRGIIPIVACSAVLLVGGITYFLYTLDIESSAGRFFVWDVSRQMIEDHPVKGVGFGRFGVEYLNYQSRYFSDENHLPLAYKASNMKQAHNEYFQAFCESGIAGGVLFLSIWFCALWLLWSNKNEERTKTYGVTIVLLAILVHSFVDTVLHVVPIALVAYCLLGFVPVPASLARRIQLKFNAHSICIFILMLLYSGFVLYSVLQQYQGRRYWQKGYEYGLEHRWPYAIQEYQSALRSMPREGELLFHLGAAFVMNGSYSTGIYFLNESKKNYNDRNIHLSLAYAYLCIKDLAAAEREARIALLMFPDQLAPQLLLGQIFYKQGIPGKSQQALRKCILRESRIQSEEVNQLGLEAEDLWREYYPRTELPGSHPR